MKQSTQHHTALSRSRRVIFVHSNYIAWSLSCKLSSFILSLNLCTISQTCNKSITAKSQSKCNLVSEVKHRIKSETVHLSNIALQEHKFWQQLICHSCPVWVKNDTTKNSFYGCTGCWDSNSAELQVSIRLIPIRQMLRLGNIFLYNVRGSSMAALSGLEKRLAVKNAKSKYKSKSGKNWLKSWLKSKSSS